MLKFIVLQELEALARVLMDAGNVLVLRMHAATRALAHNSGDRCVSPYLPICRFESVPVLIYTLLGLQDQKYRNTLKTRHHEILRPLMTPVTR